MGTKTWMHVYGDSNAREALSTKPQLDRLATHRLATALFARLKLEGMGDVDLFNTRPEDDELHVECFPGVSVMIMSPRRPLIQ